MSVVEHTKTDLIAAIEEAGLDESDIKWDYSGKGMYGAECFGILCEESQLIEIAVSLARNTDGDLYWFSNFRTDNLGKGFIHYFPNVELSAEDGEI